MRSAARRAVARGLLIGIGAMAATALPGRAQAPAAAPGQPTFRTGVELVTLDVIPRSADGRFVPDLGKDDFRVVEDGVVQRVTSLVMVHGGRVFNILQPSAPSAASPEGIILPRARPAADAAGRIFVLLVDDLHFTAPETPLVRSLLRKITGQLFHDGDMLAMFSTGPSSIEVPISYDRKAIEAAISRVGGHGMSYRDIMDSRDGAQGPQGLRYNAHVAFKTAYSLIADLERVGHRRKVLLLVTNGYDFDPFPGGRTGTDQVFGGRYGTPFGDAERGDRFLSLEQQHNVFADSDLAAELSAVTGAANRANAVIYTLDPRGVVGTTNLEQNVDIGEMRTHIGKTQSSLRVLADATGGFAVVNDNSYTEALARIDAETSDYYILGYTPTNPDAAHRHRQVEVTTTRPGIEVASRSWYRTRATPAPPPRP